MNTSKAGTETTNNDAVMRIVQHVKGLELGATITHEEMQEITGMKNRETRYHAIAKAKRKLIREHGIFMESLRKTGYKVVCSGYEIGVCTAQAMKAFRMEVRAAHDAMHIRTERITNKADRERTERLAGQLSARLPFTDNQLKALEALSTRGEPS